MSVPINPVLRITGERIEILIAAIAMSHAIVATAVPNHPINSRMQCRVFDQILSEQDAMSAQGGE